MGALLFNWYIMDEVVLAALAANVASVDVVVLADEAGVYDACGACVYAGMSNLLHWLCLQMKNYLQTQAGTMRLQTFS